MLQQLAPALRMNLFLIVLTGLLYPGVVTGICRVLFHDQANGSLITKNGAVIGSVLIAQKFERPEYFHPRPSAAGNGYDTTASGGTNLGPTSKKLIDSIAAATVQFKKENPSYTGPVPVDAVTSSGSGLDPEITPANAYAQSQRIADARGMSAAQVRTTVDSLTEQRWLGIFGEPRVNVLKLNLALDAQFPRR